ncbi:MAG: hypothetical protein HKP55_15315 [Gammaproteobacteria bacterium]|nr:hypothetical protein [Gammaproteobacteria bacterium]
MDNTIVWIIIAGFYAPLHYMPPVLLVLFKTSEENRKPELKGALVDCTISMVLAFVLVYLVGLENMLLAMMILLAALFLPYIRVIRAALRVRKAAG